MVEVRTKLEALSSVDSRASGQAHQLFPYSNWSDNMDTCFLIRGCRCPHTGLLSAECNLALRTSPALRSQLPRALKPQLNDIFSEPVHFVQFILDLPPERNNNHTTSGRESSCRIYGPSVPSPPTPLALSRSNNTPGLVSREMHQEPSRPRPRFPPQIRRPLHRYSNPTLSP